MKYRIVEYPGYGCKAQKRWLGIWWGMHEFFFSQEVAQHFITTDKTRQEPPKVVHEEEG